MLIEELKDIITNIQSIKAESQKIEVKAAHIGCPKRLYGTLSSFSNQEGGGIIVFGLDEEQDFKVVGVYDPQDLQQKVNEQCKQMSPTVRPLFTMVDIEGKTVVSAEIPEIDTVEKPCFYKGAGRIRGTYIRAGDADEPMTEYEIYSYEAFRQKYQDDIRTVDRASLEDLDQLSLDFYINTLRRKKPNMAKLEKERIMELLSITRNSTPTLAAVMLFCQYPQVYFPQFCITAVVVPGYEMGETGEDDERFIDNRRIEGTIPQMLDDSITFVQKNMSVKTIIDNKTGNRRDKPEYPIKAVREAILNALIHRDYSFHTEGTPIQIIFFKDRLEIHNPGGLYGRMTINQLGRVQADTRNPVLASALEVMGIAENRYSGIPTIMREMDRAGLTEPKFYSERGSFSVKFFNKKVEDITWNTDTKKITDRDLIRFCATPRSRNEITEFLGLTTNYYAMQSYVLPLVEKGLLKMTIPEKPKSRNQKYVSSVVK